MTDEYPCHLCDEPMLPGESTVPLTRMHKNKAWQEEVHRVCMLRTVVGSVAHQLRICSCYVEGSTKGDPQDMTLKQGAEAAVELWEWINRMGMSAADPCEKG